LQRSIILKVHCADTRHSAEVRVTVRIRVRVIGLGLVGILHLLEY